MNQKELIRKRVIFAMEYRRHPMTTSEWTQFFNEMQNDVDVPAGLGWMEEFVVQEEIGDIGDHRFVPLTKMKLTQDD